jgi:very-short-patch-repair endonuclease
MTSSAIRQRRLSALADDYDGVLSRSLLSEAGVDRRGIGRQVDGARWRRVGSYTVATHTGALSLRALAWRAIWEVNRRDVAVDGVSAMVDAGLTGFELSTVEVSVPWPIRVRPIPGVRVHRVCREEAEVITAGLPRVGTPTATIRAANWASSDRQAALLLALPVQQRLLTPARLEEARKTDHVRGRRELVRQLVDDLVDGAHSLGELDFARLCRQAGLPEPDRQVVRRSPKGRIYLDVRWSGIGLVVEIDGSGHRHGLAVTDDNLRQNLVTLSGDMVLRFDLLALRLRPDQVLSQVCGAHAILTARHGS